MDMPFRAEAITLTAEERAELEEMTKSRTLPAGDVFRARLILMLADGLAYRTIQQKLDTMAPTIARWKERFQQQRMQGLLEIRHPGQKPSVITAALQAKVLEATRHKPKDGSTHWSCRKLAQQLGVSKDTVQRIWHKAGLKPHDGAAVIAILRGKAIVLKIKFLDAPTEGLYCTFDDPPSPPSGLLNRAPSSRNSAVANRWPLEANTVPPWLPISDWPPRSLRQRGRTDLRYRDRAAAWPKCTGC